MKQDSQMFGTEKISKILWKMAPPVMLAQLIQVLYNIVDSFFVGRYSESGLTALSIIYPIQLLMIVFAVGTGVGINTCMAHYLGLSEDEKADEIGGIGTPLTLFMWAVFAVVCYFFMPAYAKMSTDSAEVIKEVITYGRIAKDGNCRCGDSHCCWTDRGGIDRHAQRFSEVTGAICVSARYREDL